MVKFLDCQSGEPGIESSAAILNLAISFTPNCHSSLNCINEYVAIDSGGYINTNCSMV